MRIVPRSWGRRILVGALLMGASATQPVRSEATLEPTAERCFSVSQSGGGGAIAILNLTPVNASAPGYGYVSYKENGAVVHSDASNVNFGPGTVDPNVAVVPTSLVAPQYYNTGVAACFVNSKHSTVDLVVDALGLITSAAFVPPQSGVPTRVLDTRIGHSGTRLAPNGRACFQVTGLPGDIALINLTPVLASNAGYGLLVSSDLTSVPVASNVNFAPGTIDPNVAVARIGADGRVCFVNSNHGTVDVVADHLGSIKRDSFVLASASGAPVRVLDTRLDEHRLAPGARLCFAVAGSPGDAALVNLTPVRASAGGYGVLVSSDVTTVPLASNVNFAPGTIDPNVAIAPIGADGQVCFVNSKHGNVDLVADHLGSIASGAYIRSTPTGAPGRLLDTRPIGEITLTTSAMSVQAMDCADGGGLCLVAGQSSDGHVAVAGSIDEGRVWSTPSVLAATGTVEQVACPSVSTCYVVGGDAGSALMLKTQDAGVTFDTVSTPPGTTFKDISCASAEVCMGVTDVSPPKLLRTADGGNTWNPLFPDFVDVSEIDCATIDDCFITGQLDGSYPGGMVFLFVVARSTDGGRTWQTYNGPESFTHYDGLHCFGAEACTVLNTYSFFHIMGTRNRTILGTTEGSTAAPAFGGTVDCASRSKCVESAGASSAYTWSTGSSQWTEYDIAVPGPSATQAVSFLGCPLADTCFYAGSRDSWVFLTRAPLP